MPVGYPTKVQLIKRKESEQWYINFPSAVARAMEFERGEIVEWIIEDKGQLVLQRVKVPPSARKKNGWNDRCLRRLVEPGAASLWPGADVAACPHLGAPRLGGPHISGRANRAGG